MIKRCFSNLSHTKLKTLYISLIRPGLEYASIIWSPWLQKDITALEKCQRPCLRLRNEEIRLPSLKSHRDIYDMVETYKFSSGN